MNILVETRKRLNENYKTEIRHKRLTNGHYGDYYGKSSFIQNERNQSEVGRHLKKVPSPWWHLSKCIKKYSKTNLRNRNLTKLVCIRDKIIQLETTINEIRNYDYISKMVQVWIWQKKSVTPDKLLIKNCVNDF